MGDDALRRAGWVCLLTIFATQFASLLGPSWHGPEYGVLVVDTVCAVALAKIACKDKTWWSIIAAASQIDGTLMHFVPAIVRKLPDTIYLWIQPGWAIGVFGALAWGVAQRRRVIRRDGAGITSGVRG